MSISASPASLHPKFESFLNKRFVVNVSDPTLDWYRPSLKWLPSPDLTTDDLKAIVIKMREAGLKPSSVACRLRAIRSYIRWAGLQVIVPKIRIEQRELPTFGPDAVAALGKGSRKRLGSRDGVLGSAFFWTVALDELSVTWKDVNLNDCLVTLWGKGSKQTDGTVLEGTSSEALSLVTEVVIYPGDGLRVLYETGTEAGATYVLRDVKILCRELGFEPPLRTLHACRHSFATFFIRSGGNPLTLQRLLGHTSLEMTRRYVSLNVEDLRREHRSLLASGTSSAKQETHAPGTRRGNH